MLKAKSLVKSDEKKYPELKWFMNEEFSDFAFVVEDKRIPIFKALLTMKSDVFRTMFNSDFKESSAKETTVEGTTYEAFKTFIRFLYVEEVVIGNPKDPSLVNNICQLADKYQVLRYFDKLAIYYRDRVTIDNMEWLYEISKLYRVNLLIEYLNNWIGDNLGEWYGKHPSDLGRINNLTDGQIMLNLAKNFKKLYNSKAVSCYHGHFHSVFVKDTFSNF